MRDQQKAEAIAQERMQLLAPLLAEGLDPAKAKQLKSQICTQTGISDRTLRRYLAQYKAGGFNALKPKDRGRESQAAIPEHVMEHAERCPAAVWPRLFRSWSGKAWSHQKRLNAALSKIGCPNKVTVPVT